MAYRFNPPPTWPIADASWTPPPGWQPDPSWGPAPEGWEFWIAEDDAPAHDSDPADAVVPTDAEVPADIAPPATEGLAPKTDKPGAMSDQSDVASEQADSVEDKASASPVAEHAGSSAVSDPYSYGHELPAYDAPSVAPAFAPQSEQTDAAPGSSASTWGSASGPIVAGEPPRKGIIARFWWVGCIVLTILALILVGAGIALSVLLKGHPDATSAAPSVSATAATGRAQSFTTSDGSGTVSVVTSWKPASALTTKSGSSVKSGSNPEYLVVTVTIHVDQGSAHANPFQFDVVGSDGTPVDPASVSYSLKDSGAGDHDDLSVGQDATVTMLFDVPKEQGMTLHYDTYSHVYEWNVPE